MRMQRWKSKGHTQHQVFGVCSHLYPKSALASVVQLGEFKMQNAKKKNQDSYTAVILLGKGMTVQNKGLHIQIFQINKRLADKQFFNRLFCLLYIS